MITSSKEENHNVSHNLKKLRDIHGLSLPEMAAILEIPLWQVIAIEKFSDAEKMDTSFFLAIASNFYITPRDFFKKRIE